MKVQIDTWTDEYTFQDHAYVWMTPPAESLPPRVQASMRCDVDFDEHRNIVGIKLFLPPELRLSAAIRGDDT